VRPHQRGAHRCQVRGGEQFVATPPDGEAPDGAGEVAVGLLEHLADLDVATPTFDGGPCVDDDLGRIGCDGMRHLKIHRQLAAGPTRLATHDDGGELGKSEHRGERVEVGLVESVEGEDHDRLALAGEPGAGQCADVVGVEQGGGVEPAVGYVEWQVVRPRHAVRHVAQDPTEFGDLVPQRRRHLRLLRGGVELLAPLAAVVVHLDVQGVCHRSRRSFDHRPGIAWPPLHRETLCCSPFDQRDGTVRPVERGGELNVVATGGTEIGRRREQQCERPVDREPSPGVWAHPEVGGDQQGHGDDRNQQPASRPTAPR
jgi:hypothetical protein